MGTEHGPVARDLAEAAVRAGDDPSLASLVSAFERVRLPGETVCELAVARTGRSPSAVAVTTKRILVDALAVSGEVHALPRQAVTGSSMIEQPDGSVDLELSSLGESVLIAGLSGPGARRLRWAIGEAELKHGRLRLDIAARFNAWIDVVGDDEISDDERAEEIDRILSP